MQIFIIFLLFLLWITPLQGKNHVHLMHLDGVRSDLIEAMIDANQLPFMKMLLERGKISYKVSTVDKSETMKVIPSYLSSRVESEVVGWWQFSRTDFSFRNFWLDPVEVLNYALGLEFPLYPTLFDFLAAHNERVVAGFHLHRRGVEFHDYARAYLEGLKAALGDHTYLHQARATMDDTLRILKNIVLNNEKFPILSTSLIAAVDEFSHNLGVTPLKQPNNPQEFCFDRKSNKIFTPIFDKIDKEIEIRALYGSKLKTPYNNYFSKIRWKNYFSNGPSSLCISIPRLKIYKGESNDPVSLNNKPVMEYATPQSVLGMIFYDIELGRLIETLKSFRFTPSGQVMISKSDGGQSVFDNTLFLIFGDHGFVNSKHQMKKPDINNPSSERHENSIDQSFIQYLNERLGLKNPGNLKMAAAKDLYGIDDENLPSDLVFPHKILSWQNSEIRTLTANAEKEAMSFLQKATTLMTEEMVRKYWWLFFLKSVIERKVEEGVAPYVPQAIDMLTKLYLRGDRIYVQAEKKYLKDFYNRHIRLVYGGGARNNAEIFLPTRLKNGSFRWDKRPGFDEILNYPYEIKESGQRTLLDIIKDCPATGLIFIRENNGDIIEERPLAPEMNILVMDRAGNKGIISVKKNYSGKLSYTYDVIDKKDPLGYLNNLSSLPPQGGEYSAWNDYSAQMNHYYHNAVAGIGSLLYTNNPATGDLLIMHSQDWNFGGNAGGHGGLHRGEKLSFMLVSGPKTTPGSLWSINSNGEKSYPTLLDMAPTILNYLGYGPKALTRFSRDSGFKNYFTTWSRKQKNDLIVNLGDMNEMKNMLQESGLSGMDAKTFINSLQEDLKRILQFLPEDLPPLPDYSLTEEDGNLLVLD